MVSVASQPRVYLPFASDNHISGSNFKQRAELRGGRRTNLSDRERFALIFSCTQSFTITRQLHLGPTGPRGLSLAPDMSPGAHWITRQLLRKLLGLAAPFFFFPQGGSYGSLVRSLKSRLSVCGTKLAVWSRIVHWRQNWTDQTKADGRPGLCSLSTCPD